MVCFFDIITLMVKHKVTIKEIAEEAGVSIATVSYVLNNRVDQKISDEKRKKILQLANLYNYVKNPVAASLANGRSGLISVIFPKSDNLLTAANDWMILTRLSKAFSEKGFRVCEETSQFPSGAGLDAIVAIGLPKSRFREIGNNIYIPLISVDSLIDEWLFNQISDDYDALSGRLVSLPIVSDEYRAYLQSRFDLIEVNGQDEVPSGPAYVRDPVLISLCPGLTPIDSFSERKIDKIVELTVSSIEGGQSARVKI